MPITTMISAGGPTSPVNAAIAPGIPRRREPNTKVRLTMLGPGRKWQSAKVSLNSSAVIHLCWSTMPRRAQTRTPPKPASDILAKATNSVRRSGGDLTRSGAVAAAGDESGGMASFKGSAAERQPLFPHIHVSRCRRLLFPQKHVFQQFFLVSRFGHSYRIEAGSFTDVRHKGTLATL